MNAMSLFKITLFSLFIYANTLFGIPVVDSVNPNHGPTTGGNSVMIHGTGFVEVTAVNFGNVTLSPTSFTVISDSAIEVTTVPAQVFGAVHVTITTSSGTSSQTFADYYTYQGEWIAFVTNTLTNNLLPITNLTSTSPLILEPISIGNDPIGIAITPNGQRAYITHSPANLQGFVNFLNIVNSSVSASIDLPNTLPKGIAITPNGQIALVVSSLSPTGSVIPITIATNTAGSPIPVGNTPELIAITPNGQLALVPNFLANSSGVTTITPINLITQEPEPPISYQGVNPSGIAITPNGLTAYFTDFFLNNVYPLDLTVTPPTVGAPIPVKTNPINITISPNGVNAYATNQGSNSVSPITIATNTAQFAIGVTRLPDGIAITPDSSRAFVVDTGSNRVTFIDIVNNDNTVLGNLHTGAESRPELIAITPDQAPVATFTFIIAPVGSNSQFDASASVSPVGTIANYAWDFGDGSTTNTTNPTIQHTYQTSGVFEVTLTVTNSAGTSTTQIFTGQTVSNNGGPSATVTQTIRVQLLPSPVPPCLCPMPPTNLRGFQVVKCECSDQIGQTNIVTWQAPTSGSEPAFYRIYRNQELTRLAAIIPANKKLKFKDPNCKKECTYSYFIVTIDSAGQASSPTSVTIHPSQKE